MSDDAVLEVARSKDGSAARFRRPDEMFAERRDAPTAVGLTASVCSGGVPAGVEPLRGGFRLDRRAGSITVLVDYPREVRTVRVSLLHERAYATIDMHVLNMGRGVTRPLDGL